MTDDNSPGAAPLDQTDAELAALLPRRSAGRIALWVAVFVVAVGVAAGLPSVLNPGITEGHSGRGAMVPGTPYMVSDYAGMATDGMVPVDLVSVGRVSGAEVVGAWLASADQAERAMDALPGPDAPRQQLDAAGVRELLGTASMRPLPARVDGGDLIVLWRITDCGALPDADTPVPVTVRSLLGALRDQAVLPAMVAPVQDDVKELANLGMCPT